MVALTRRQLVLALSGLLLVCELLAVVAKEGNSTPHKHPKRVAVVGGGASGAGSVAFLKKMLGENVHVTVFERSFQAGGRIASVAVDGIRSELGGSVYHDSNLYFHTFAEGLNLTTGPPSFAHTDGLPFAIFDGERVVLEASELSLVTLTRLFWRYGMSFYYGRKVASEVKDRFAKMYVEQEEGRFHDQPSKLWDRVGLRDLSDRTLREELLDSAGVSVGYVDEFVAGITRNNYGQSPAHMNALAGYVGMVGTGGALKQVYGGNAQVVEKSLEMFADTVHYCSEVQEVNRRSTDGRLELTTIRTDPTQFPDAVEPVSDGARQRRALCSKSSKDGGRSDSRVEEPFDIVILAAPLESFPVASAHAGANQNLRTNINSNPSRIRTFHTTFATFLTAQFRPEAVYSESAGYDDSSDAPFRLLMTVDNPTLPFRTIGRMARVNETHSVYKIFSEKPISAKVLSKYFRNIGAVKSIGWKAYPVHEPGMLSPSTTNDSFDNVVLDNGVFYSSSFETAASCIEVVLVGAANTAIGVCQALGGGESCKLGNMESLRLFIENRQRKGSKHKAGSRDEL